MPLCHNTGGHRFPKDEHLRKLWILAIRRDNFMPSKHSRVCKLHFTDDDYIKQTAYGE